MSCRDWQERIALDAGGDLEGPDRAKLERHLSDCAECREFARGMADSLAEIREARGQEIAPGHYAAVRARVLFELRASRRRWAWICAAAGCAALALLALWTLPWGRPELPPVHVALARPKTQPLPTIAVSRDGAAPRPVHHARPKRASEPLVMKIETGNPDVVIYWIAN